VIGVVTNPNALGVARDRALGERLQAMLGGDGVVRETRSPGELRDVLGSFRAAGCTVVGICGGDGTNLATITEALRVWDGAAAKRYLMLKSRVHWRAGLGGIARAVVECAGSGVCTSDYSQLQFKRVRRPVYPLDEL